MHPLQTRKTQKTRAILLLLVLGFVTLSVIVAIHSRVMAEQACRDFAQTSDRMFKQLLTETEYRAELKNIYETARQAESMAFWPHSAAPEIRRGAAAMLREETLPNDSETTKRRLKAYEQFIVACETVR
jgi:hypothetical protein